MITSLTKGNTSVAQSSFTTASVSPTANSLILVGVVNDNISGSALIPTLSGNGITWTQATTVPVSYDHNFRLTLFRGTSTNPSSGIITISFSGNQVGCSWIVDQATLINLSGNPILQSANNTVAGTSLSVILSAFNSSKNPTYGVIASDQTTTITHGTNFTELGNQASNTAIASQWAASNQTTVDWTSSNANLVAIGVEIKARSIFQGSMI